MTRTLLLLVPLVLTLTACARVPVLAPEGVSVIRSYRFETTVADPQAAWNPASHLIVARHAQGFATYQEGSGRQEYFTAADDRPIWFPVWLSRDQFVFSGPRNVSRDAEGRVLPSTEGMTVVTVVDDGRRCAVERTMLADRGHRPRTARGEIYAQMGRTMAVVDRYGKISDAGEGFWAEPQATGPGIAWNETPVVEADPWTAKPGRGNLIVRWRPGVISTIPGGVQPRWIPGGGLVCTVVRGDPVPERPWWQVGSDVVHLAGPDAVPVVIATDARDPAPHPDQPLVAVSARDGGLRLVALDPAIPAKTLTTAGQAPAWSFDGLRLMAEERNPQRLEATILRVHVLRTVPR